MTAIVVPFNELQARSVLSAVTSLSLSLMLHYKLGGNLFTTTQLHRTVDCYWAMHMYMHMVALFVYLGVMAALMWWRPANRLVLPLSWPMLGVICMYTVLRIALVWNQWWSDSTDVCAVLTQWARYDFALLEVVGVLSTYVGSLLDRKTRRD